MLPALAAELKREGKNPSAQQAAWLAALEAAGVEVFVWRPGDWMDGTIEGILR